MIIKFIDVYLETKLSSENASHYIEKNLEEHIREMSDFDLEHFIEKLEDTDKFQITEIDEKEECQIEYTQEEIESFVEKITDEMYDEFEEDEENDEYDDEYDEYEDEEDEENNDGGGWE